MEFIQEYFKEVHLHHSVNFTSLVLGFAFNTLVTVVIARFVYYPKTRKKDYLSTYVLFSIIIFFLCNLLSSVDMSMGFALGLFAIFGIIRYRTDALEIKDMTYLFIVIGVSVLNALSNDFISKTELLFTNLMIVVFTYGLEKRWIQNDFKEKLVVYENIELVKLKNNHLLIEDLKERLDVDIRRVDVESVDFMRDSAILRVFYNSRGNAFK